MQSSIGNRGITPTLGCSIRLSLRMVLEKEALVMRPPTLWMMFVQRRPCCDLVRNGLANLLSTCFSQKNHAG